ncbi:MAG TPA: glutaredoxin family protein [Firmicutes bacterium]|nr:glutaredoxin family protein [Bacillota bacterium]
MLDLYIKEGCPHCRKQIEALEREGLSYRLHNVREDAALREAKVRYGADKVPVLVEKGTVKAIGFQGKG